MVIHNNYTFQNLFLVNNFMTWLLFLVNNHQNEYMLAFRKIELSDKQLIDSYLQGNNYRSSDLCFCNLYCWQEKFKTEFTTTSEWLLIRFRDNVDGNSYLLPIGKGDLKEVVNLLKQDSEKLGTRFQIRGLTQQMCNELQAVEPDRFTFNLNRSVSDYIYTSEKLIHLTGKKLQSKRNHINRFTKENNWSYKSLTNNPDLVKECHCMLQQWMIDNAEDKDPSLVYDNIATKLMLENFEYFGLRGGVICVEGRMVAFSLGEPLTQDTFIVHVEKAMTENVHGAYAIINQQFVLHEAAEFTYINREEDMGIESLRKAKLSYQPDILLEKFVAREKEQ